MWIAGGLLSPLLGFYAVWQIRHSHGHNRYRALWLRLAADIGIASTLGTYELQRLFHEFQVTEDVHPFVDALFLGALGWVLVIIQRDLRFLFVTERVADEIRRVELVDATGG